MHENLKDITSSYTGRQMRARSLGRRRGVDWVEVDYTFARTEGKQPVGEGWCLAPARRTAIRLLPIRKPGMPFALDLAWPLLVWFTERIFKEDRWIVAREQEAHDKYGQTGITRYFRSSTNCETCRATAAAAPCPRSARWATRPDGEANGD